MCPRRPRSITTCVTLNQRTVAEIMARVKKAAEGAALGTGTSYCFQQIGGTFSLPNDTLGRMMDANLRRVGGVAYTPEEQAFATAIASSLPGGKAGSPATEIAAYRVGDVDMASTDVGDVSYTIPTVGLVAGAWVPGTPPHSWQAVAASGSSIGLKGALVAAKAMALTAADLFGDPAALSAAKAELDRRRGADFVYRPLLGDIAPALDYRKGSTGS
ncbi:hypothetical protein AB5I41_12330 [Sphingomonas sp. MMS24-JH45]